MGSRRKARSSGLGPSAPLSDVLDPDSPLSSLEQSAPTRTRGTNAPETLIGGDGHNRLRGRGGPDTLWGDRTDGSQGGSDTFVFEKSFRHNGRDTIKDYHWSADGADNLGQDQLDLTKALKRFNAALKKDPSTSFGDYVWLQDSADGARLMIDQDGKGTRFRPRQWASLEGISSGEDKAERLMGASLLQTTSTSGQVSVVNGNQSYLLAYQTPPLQRILVIGASAGTFGSDNGAYAWFDVNDNGQLDAAEVTDSNRAYFSGSDANVELDSQSYSINFLGTGNANAGGFPAIDLSGFGLDDNIVVNYTKPDGSGTTNASYSISGKHPQLAQAVNSSGVSTPIQLPWGKFERYIQRGRSSAEDKRFDGYTYGNKSSTRTSHAPAYYSRVSKPSVASRYQQYRRIPDKPTGISVGLKVSMQLETGSLKAGFQNFFHFQPPAGIGVPNYPTYPAIDGVVCRTERHSVLANWSAATTIYPEQISVLWPDYYYPPAS